MQRPPVPLRPSTPQGGWPCPSARRSAAAAGAALALVGLAGCGGRDPRRAGAESGVAAQEMAASASTPDGVPRMLNPDPPFRYPPALYAQRVQGNVVLRLFIDELGRVVPESTQVTEGSGYAPLDSAAVRGSEALRFAPATRDGRPVAAPMLFPVHFRHPQARPLPGDTGGARP